MATTVTKVIDPDMGSGYDYDSLFDWEAAQQGDLTGARDEIAVAKCRCTAGTADTTAVTIDGWTTSATQYIKIWTDPSESYRHNGTWQTGNKYRIEAINLIDDGWTIINRVDYTKIIGLQISANGSTGSGNGCVVNATIQAATNTLLDSCILKPISSSIGIGAVGFSWAINCLSIGGAAGFSGGAITAFNHYFYNCTAINPVIGGFLSAHADSTMVCKNCLCDSTAAYSFGAFAQLVGTIQTSYCASDDATADDSGATGARTNQTFTFVNSGAGDYHLASNDAGALGYGLNLYNDATYPFQTDIDGHDRGGTGADWDIGADQWVPTGSTAWGHDTGVTQENIRNFDGKWYGTGEVISTGDGERIELASGEYLISEIIIVPADSTVTLRKNSYFARS
jgi:hypothetical protein